MLVGVRRRRRGCRGFIRVARRAIADDFACGCRLDVYQLTTQSGGSGAGKLELGWGVAVAGILGLVIAFMVLG